MHSSLSGALAASRLSRHLSVVAAAAAVILLVGSAVAATTTGQRHVRRSGRAVTARTRPADLTVRSAVARLSTDGLTGSFVAANKGRSAAPASKAAVAWSGSGTRGWKQLGLVRVPKLARGAHVTRRFVLDLPRGATAGRYAVSVCADARSNVREVDEHDNCAAAGKVTIAASSTPGAPVTGSSGPGTQTPPGPSTGFQNDPTTTQQMSPPDVPDTRVDSAPGPLSSSRVATFAFSSDTAGATFECSLDRGAWAACSSPATFTGLSDGAHAFDVRALAAAGTDVTPAHAVWTIDATAPDTTIAGAPPAVTNITSASIMVSSNEPGASFSCRADDGPWAPCASPFQLAGLADGAHGVDVRASDPAGNVDASPAHGAWTVDTVAPQTTITSAPSGTINQASAQVTFGADDAAATYTCRVDGGAWATCVSPFALTGLSDATHAVDVRATDTAGNTDDTPAHATWIVEATPPHTTISSAPPTTTNALTADVAFSVSEQATTVCKLDAAAYAACTSPVHFTGLAAGIHHFTVRATDTTGNVEVTPVDTSWTVDTTAPQTTITGAPRSPTRSTTAQLTLAADEPGSTFECRMDSGAWAACTSPFQLASLADGSHTVQSRATDPAGNVDATPAQASWTVDLTAPETTVTKAPATTIPDGPVTIEFQASEAGATFACRLDGATASACTSPVSLSNPGLGTHTLEIRATDTAGNTETSPAVVQWTATDTTPPAVPTGVSADPRDSAARIGWTAVADGSEYRVWRASAQNGPWTLAGTVDANATSLLVDGLTNGVTYWFAVSARDASGNESARSPAVSAKPEAVNGVSHCGTIAADETWPAATTHVLTCNVTVAPGAKLTLAPGAVVKATNNSSLTVAGELSATGTSDAPITFTSTRDDAVGGDFNGDGTDTTPAARDWGGISVAGPDDQPASIRMDHAVIRYAALSVTSRGDDRDSTNFVARTVTITNSKFEHGSGITLDVVGPTEVTGNTITNAATAEWSGTGIAVNQSGYLSTTTVSGNTVSGASQYGVSVTVRPESTASPVVQSNVVSNTGLEPISVQSSRLVPANLTGNTGASSTRRGLLLSGTLVQDLELPFQSLPVTIGYPGLVVGQDAKLTVDAGVVVKSYSTYLSVAGGSLIAAGTPQAPAVFTSIHDDSAGGDYEGDGNTSTPTRSDWYGISVSGSNDHQPSVSLDHADVRYAGVSITNSGDDRDQPNYVQRTTSVTNSKFSHGASLSVNASGPIAVTGNTITNSGSAEQVGDLIDVWQSGFLATTTVSGNTVSGGAGLGVSVFVRPESTSSPVVQNNAASNTALEPVSVGSSRLVPANLTGNTGAASTRRGLRLAGTLVADLSLPFETLPVTIGSDNYYYGGLNVGAGAKLSLAAGVVVKSYAASLSITGGTLVAAGTAQSPVVLTSYQDDSAGGDYNKDGDVTTPARNDWYGISSSDGGDTPSSVSLDHVDVRYAGVSISNSGDDRDQPNYAARTTSVTSSKFSHGSWIGVNAAGPVAVSGNTITNSGTAEWVGDALSVRQNGFLSSTTVSGNTVSGASGLGVSVFVRPEATASPVVQNNAVSNTGREPVSVMSSRLVPANLTGNTGATTTRRGLLLAGTLVADLALPFQTLPVTIGSDNYYYGGLNVGAGAKLSIGAGVVMKSYAASLSVTGGTLVAAGTAQSPVVFTSYKDDSAGGDYNKDGDVTTPARNDWYGISSSDGGDTPSSVSLDHVNLRYAAVSITSRGDDRNDPDYAPRAASVTNSSLAHGAYLSVDAVGPVVVTGNAISNTGASEQASNLIDVHQRGYVSPTTVSGNTVSGASGFGVNVWVRDDAETSPVVQSNTVSNTSSEAVAVHSTLLSPANLTGNTGGAGTKKALRLSGTLVQSMTLPFGNLAVVLGASCCADQGGLTIGPDATLTVSAGVIVKSYGGGITVDGGSLTGNGTTANPVVFTSVHDDSAGGDYNQDGTVTVPSIGDWAGLSVTDGGTLSIAGGQIHYASTAVANSGGTATYRGKLTNNYYGATGSCSPYFEYPVDARNVDWGTPSGPWPYGSGDAVDQCVLVQPWVGQTVFRARYWGGPYGDGGWAGSAWGSYGYAHRYGGDPVDVATGNLSIATTDVTVPEPGPAMTFARAYNSQSDLTGVLGHGWTTSWETYGVLPASSPLGTYDVHWGDGRIDSFTERADGTFAAATGDFTTLKAAGAGVVATTKDGTRYALDGSGLLTTVTDRHGNALTVSRDASSRVSTVTDGAGRKLTLAYAGTRLSSVTDPDGKSFTFGFTGSGDLAQVTDPTGAIIHYTYDGAHQLLTATDANGQQALANVYDINGRVTSQQDANGGTTTFQYDWSNARTIKVDPRGGQRIYGFDQNGQVTSETDPTGGTTTTIYTSAGQPFRVVDALGRATAYTYDSSGNLLTVKDPRGKITTAVYNAMNLPTKVTDPAGGVSEFTYDAQGSLAATTDPRSNTTHYSVDARGLRTSLQTPDGKTTTYAYDSMGNATSITDPLGHATSSDYDADGRITTARNALGKATTYTYNARGDIIGTTDPLGRQTTTAYDNAGRQVTTTDPLGHATRWTYTPSGLVATVKDPLGGTTTNTYDANGNVATTEDPTGSTTSYAWDLSNRMTSSTDPTGATTQYRYDAAGELTSTTDPLGHVTTKDYDASGEVSRLTNPLGNVTAFAYDAAGRLVDVTDANHHHWTYGYDPAGNRVLSQDPLNRMWATTYDAENRPSTSTAPDASVTTRSYDAAGRLTATDHPGSADASYTYDATDRLTGRTDVSGSSAFTYADDGQLLSAKDGLGRTLSYTYDAAGRLASRTQGSSTTQLGYDAADRLVTAADPAGNATWSYDASGEVTGATYPGGVAMTATRDAAHRLTGVSYARSGSTVFSDARTYDAAGRVTERDDPTGAHTYDYDAADQLLSDTVGGSTTTWSYDKVGNRLGATAGAKVSSYAYDAADQLASIDGAAVQYDGRGELTKEPTSGGSSTYSYDGAGHMVGMATPAGTWDFLVDDDGTLLRQSGTTTSTYLFDQQSHQLLGQDSARTLVGATPYGVTDSGTTRALLADASGNVRLAIGASGSGTALDYSALGALAGGSTQAQDGVPSYSQGVIQPDGTIRLGQRVLDPAVGRWTSPDPTGLREGGGAFGPYVYGSNSPLRLSDPTGTSSILSSIAHTVGSIANGIKVVASVAGSKAISTVFGTVSRVASGIGDIADVVSDIWGAFTNRDGYVNRASGSPARILTQDSYGGVLGAPLNRAYDDARPDLQQLGVDREVQCYTGALTRTMSTTGKGGQLGSDFMTISPQPTRGNIIGIVKDSVGFFTSYSTTADYTQRCFAGA